MGSSGAARHLPFSVKGEGKAEREKPGCGLRCSLATAPFPLPPPQAAARAEAAPCLGGRAGPGRCLGRSATDRVMSVDARQPRTNEPASQQAPPRGRGGNGAAAGRRRAAGGNGGEELPGWAASKPTCRPRCGPCVVRKMLPVAGVVRWKCPPAHEQTWRSATATLMLKRGREEDHGAASSDVATSEEGAQKAKDQLLHDLFACSPQQTSTDGSVAAAAARPAVGAMGPPNGGQARGPNTQSELQFRAVHRLTRCPPPLLPAPSPPPPPTPPTPPPTPVASSAAVDPPPSAPPSCAKRTTPTHPRTRLTPASPRLASGC